MVSKQSNTPAFHGWQSLVLWPCPSDFTFWNLSFPIYSADDNTSYTGLLGQLNGMFIKSTQQSDWYLEVTPLPLNSKVKVQRLLNHTVSNTVRTNLVNRLTVTVHYRQSHHLASPNSPKQFPLSYLKLNNNNNNNKKPSWASFTKCHQAPHVLCKWSVLRHITEGFVPHCNRRSCGFLIFLSTFWQGLGFCKSEINFQKYSKPEDESLYLANEKYSDF